MEIRIMIFFFLSSILMQGFLASLLDYQEIGWPQICQTGMKQSPIDIPNKNASCFNITRDYFSIISSNYTPVSGVAPMVYHEYKYMVNLTTMGYLYVTKNGIKYAYQPADMHFHFYSEHTIQGLSYDIEMHIVHMKNNTYTLPNNPGLTADPDPNAILVVGVLFKAGGTVVNTAVEQMNIKTKSSLIDYDLNQFVDPQKKSYFFYEGGLTTPGCDEVVNWVVMEKIENITVEQMNEFKEWIGEEYKAGNARKTKPLNGRTIYYVAGNSTAGAEMLGINYLILLIAVYFLI